MRRIARRLTVALVLIGTLTAFAAPAAAAPTPSPTSPSSTAAPAQPSAAPVTLTVTSINPTYLTPGSDLTVSGKLTNSGTTNVEAPQVFVRLDHKLINTRSAMANWLSSDDDSRGTVVGTTELPATLSAGSSQAFTVTVPANELGFSATSRWGARALTVGATTVSPITIEPTRTSIVWYPNTKVSPTNVSVLVPVVGPKADPATGTIDSAELAGELAGDGRLAKLAPTASDSHFSWVIDPSLLPALTDLSHSADGSATATAYLSSISSLASSGRLGVLPYDDADTVALAHANATSLWSDVFSRSTKATADLGHLPTITWPAAGHADEQLAKTASSTDALAVVRSDEQDYTVKGSKPAKEPNYTPTAHTTITSDGSSTNTLVADPVLSQLVQNPNHLSDAVLTQQLLGELSVITNESPSQSRSVVAMATRNWQPSASSVAAIDAGLDAPWISSTSLTDLLDSPVDSQVTFNVPNTIDTDTVISPSDISQMSTIRSDADAFAKIFDSDTAASFAARYDDGLLSLLAVQWRSDPDGRTSALDNIDRSLTKEKDGVQLVHGSQIYLVASDTTIRVSVRNTLPDPVTVSVQLTPRRPGLVINAQPGPLRVDAGTEASSQVSISAVGNTAVPIDAELLNPDGTPIATVPDAIDVRVNAGVEDVVLWIATALLGVIIVIGLIRTIRRGIRRDGSRSGSGPA